jgi:hypothetical protein
MYIGIGNKLEIAENSSNIIFKQNLLARFERNLSNISGQITNKLNENGIIREDKLTSFSSTQRREYLPNKLNDLNEKKIFGSTYRIKRNKLKIGILIPSTTRKLKIPNFKMLSLTKICMPSIFITIERMYDYHIYIGIDKGDYLESVLEKLEMSDRVKAVFSTGTTFTRSVNAMARKAYQDGMDYLVRVNDDSSFETKNWTSRGISVLRHYSPSNIGVVGPTCHQGNRAILTHDMVHRTHLDIFDFYYPPYFDNWWSDNWITRVYSSDRSTKLASWIIKHHTGYHGKRYNVDTKKQARLEKLLSYDKQRLDEYISSLEKMMP